MVKGLRRFFQAPLSKKLFFLKTLCVSFLVRFLIFGVPFRWAKHLLNLNPCPPETIEPLRTKYRELIAQVLQRIREFYHQRQEDEVKHLEEKKI